MRLTTQNLQEAITARRQKRAPALRGLTMWPRGLLVVLVAAPLLAADGNRDGWTPETLREAVSACTDALVQRAWENTKRAQGGDAKGELTPELRRQLAPQIVAFRALCDCTVRETAKRYGTRDWERQGDAVARYGAELVERGVCKGPPR